MIIKSLVGKIHQSKIFGHGKGWREIFVMVIMSASMVAVIVFCLWKFFNHNASHTTGIP